MLTFFEIVEKVFGPKENGSVKPSEASFGKSHQHRLFLLMWNFVKPSIFVWAACGAMYVLVKLHS